LYSIIENRYSIMIGGAMDLNKLNKIIRSQGLNNLKMSQLCKISHTAFRNKIVGEREFKASELKRMKQVLDINDATMCDIIFGEDTIPEKFDPFENLGGY